MTTGWKLTEACRAALLTSLVPRYARVIADHVTFKAGVSEATAEQPAPIGQACIVGRADDDAGVEAYVVTIDASTARPDSGTWHVTWSLAPGREARESNAVIAQAGWTPCPPLALELVPARW